MSPDPRDRPVDPVDPAADPQIRAADRDRDRVAAILADGLATGRLSVEEYSARLDATFAARTVGELRRLLADLPRPAATPRRTPARPAEGNCLAGSWASWVVTALICLTVWAATSIAQGGVTPFWPGWVIGPWGAVLVAKTSRLPGRVPSTASRCGPRRAHTTRSG